METLNIKYHRCEDMPSFAEVSWSIQAHPELEFGQDDGPIESYLRTRIDYCPWCGLNLIRAKQEWKSNL